MPLNVRTYQCDCGLVLDRDWNAALNLAALWPLIVQARQDAARVHFEVDSLTNSLNGRGEVMPVRNLREPPTRTVPHATSQHASAI